MKNGILSLIIVLVLPILIVVKAVAATYYVSPGGNDSYGGSETIPFKTIQKAANIVNPGDTVYVRGGIYNERVVLTRSGTPGNYITFQNYPGETPILDGTGLGDGIMFHATNVSYLKIIGLTIRNHTGAGIIVQTAGTATANHIEIKGNTIYNQSYQSGSAYSHGIIVAAWPWQSSNYITDVIVDGNYLHNLTTTGNEALTVAGEIHRFQITNNTIDNTSAIGIDVIGKVAPYGRDGEWPDGGIIANNEIMHSGKSSNQSNIYIDGAKDITIENNKIHDNAGFGITVSTEDSGFTTENIIVRRNLVWNNYRGITVGAIGGTGSHYRIVHNTFATTIDNQKGSFAIFAGTDNIVRNNISYLTGTKTLYHVEQWLDKSYSAFFDYNCYYPDKGKYWYYQGVFHKPFSSFQAIGQDTHSVEQNPLFTDIDNFDFTLQAESPCIDAGDFLTTTTSSGSGTVIPVADARYFEDGYGISGVPGDTIMVGSETVKVTDVDYSKNTITIERSISWNRGDGVTYPYSGSAPDIGACEHVIEK